MKQKQNRLRLIVYVPITLRLEPLKVFARQTQEKPIVRKGTKPRKLQEKEVVLTELASPDLPL